ncbi:MAG: adenosylcobinamide-GDP ribazoletransferase [Lachnospiraceae bacterium]|nr:adenosylcobinamide-GDP ribazoletransferase [Lachnospiraceae bacterium]
MAFSMFSVLPVPKTEWNEKNMKYLLAAFPAVGAVLGLLEWGLYELLLSTGAPMIFRSALLSVTPVLYTGGIHLDGFMDVCDAQGSNREKEKRLEIMKDPHIGAFAAIGLITVMLLSFGCWCGIKTFEPSYFILMPVLSRSLSGLSTAAFPAAKENGLAAFFKETAAKGRAVSLLTLITVFTGILLMGCGIKGFFITAAAAVLFLIYHNMALKKFGGVTGDLSGWFLTVCELVMMMVYVLTGWTI